MKVRLGSLKRRKKMTRENGETMKYLGQTEEKNVVIWEGRRSTGEKRSVYSLERGRKKGHIIREREQR